MSTEETKIHQEEPLLHKSNKRYVLFPIRYPKIWDSYKEIVSTFWTAEDITLTSDQQDFKTLNDNEKLYIEHILAFFASADCIVTSNLCETFTQEVQVLEANAFFMFQASQEMIHSEVYSNMLDQLITDDRRRDVLFNALETMPAVRNKAMWCMKWSNPKLPFAKRLVCWSVVEGLLFAASFASIAWFKSRGILRGLTTANEYISRDESLHCKFATMLYRDYVVNKLSHEEVYDIINEAVEIESDFILNALPVKLIGMSSDDMLVYIKFTANRLLQMLGVPPMYEHASCPWEWVSLIGLEGQSNFFEKKTTDYQKSTLKKMDGIMDLDEAF